MLKFDVFKEKLDPMNDKGTWKGFSPRTLFPMTLINPDNVLRNTSTIVLIYDSQREVDIELAPHFSQKVLGSSETIIT
jgi:hypothetical protein